MTSFLSVPLSMGSIMHVSIDPLSAPRLFGSFSNHPSLGVDYDLCWRPFLSRQANLFTGADSRHLVGERRQRKRDEVVQAQATLQHLGGSHCNMSLARMGSCIHVYLPPRFAVVVSLVPVALPCPYYGANCKVISTGTSRYIQVHQMPGTRSGFMTRVSNVPSISSSVSLLQRYQVVQCRTVFGCLIII